MVTEIKPTFATFAKWRISPIYMVFLVKIMDNIMLMKMRITCQSFCSLSTMVVLRWASLIWKTKNSAQTLTSTSRRSSPRRSSPWDIFNRNCHNLCRILPAQVIKLLHVPIDLVDETRFPVVPQEEINEICEGGSSKNTARTNKIRRGLYHFLPSRWKQSGWI